MDQIVNHAAKLRYMSNGQFSIPLTIRTVTGGGGQLGATHSQSLEGWYASVPGLKVVAPSTPYDALGLLRSAIADDNPVIYAEHALLYGARGEVPDDWYDVPIGSATVRRDGDDVTIVAYSRMARFAEQAADMLLEKTGRKAEVIDLRSLRPLDTDTIVESVKKTGRAVVVDEAWRTGASPAKSQARFRKRHSITSTAPVVRVAGANIPAPYSRKLEAAVYPSPERIVQAVERNFGF